MCFECTSHLRKSCLEKNCYIIDWCCRNLEGLIGVIYFFIPQPIHIAVASKDGQLHIFEYSLNGYVTLLILLSALQLPHQSHYYLTLIFLYFSLF